MYLNPDPGIYKMAKKNLFLLFVLFSSIHGYSQKIDSLESLLNRAEDTVKVNLLNKLSNLYRNKGDFEKSESLAIEAENIAKKIGYPFGLYRSVMNLFSNANQKSEYAKCLDLLKKSVEIAEGLKRMDLLIQSKLRTADVYSRMDYKSMYVKLSLDAYSLALKLNDKSLLMDALSFLAGAYSKNGDIGRSNKYYFELAGMFENQNLLSATAITYSNIAENFEDKESYDTAVFYGKKAIEIYEKAGEPMNMAYLMAMLGKTYAKMNDYGDALIYFNKAIKWHQDKYNAPNTYALCLLSISEIFLKDKGNLEQNFQVDYLKVGEKLEEAIKIFKNRNRYSHLLRAYTAMREISERTGNYKLANEYSRQISITKDSLSNREQRAKVNELMIKYQVEESEQQIAQLQKEAYANNLITILLASLVTLGVFSGFLFINRQKLQYRNEKRELELTALRTQMNPHFIFNCLSSINLYIIQSEIAEATDYLTKFAKLIRSILDNSKHSLVSLKEEIKTISLYMELEAVRFSNKFSFNLHVEDKIDTESIKLSPMIIQPFIENAIWHGIQHKDGPGHIQVTFAIRDKSLLCTVQDNGVGRQKALEFQRLGSRSTLRTSKSHGIQITNERLNLLSRKGLKTSLEITDLVNGDNTPLGTKVEIALPIPKLS